MGRDLSSMSVMAKDRESAIAGPDGKSVAGANVTMREPSGYTGQVVKNGSSSCEPFRNVWI